MQTYKELVAQAHEYLKALDKGKLNKYEKLFVKSMLEDKNDLREYSFSGEIISQMPLINATALVNAGGTLPNLLPAELSEMLANYLQELHQYSPTRGIYRISLRNRDEKPQNKTCTK